ncbi:MAG TPA: type II secretion system minor pseudopilin GspK, partial [Burkholderiaceae bacterium]
AADRDAGDEGPDAFLSGFITDAQARYNLRDLIDQNKVLPGELEVLGRLCETAGVAPGLAAQIANGLLEAARADPGSDAPLMPHGVDELFWLGIDPEALRRLAPYVVLLPARTPVNVNTASREVLAAVIDGLDLASAERLVQLRQRTPFRGIEDVKRQLPSGVTLAPSRIGISSNFFEVTGRLRLEQRVLQERSLVERKGLDIVPLRRQRVNLQDSAG